MPVARLEIGAAGHRVPRPAERPERNENQTLHFKHPPALKNRSKNPSARRCGLPASRVYPISGPALSGLRKIFPDASGTALPGRVRRVFHDL
ncbi:hypothetical protein Ga0080559_TMP1487 [Salipiger profundus]|uniref:Uncharacterized protein n=1 Tax=Salipiger profundus TaxID=1229727 RepID=A0A1U7D2E5_9RHOB|nr:hypothetical protein Ga0080559_TMP1487 [Salipiger profundus]